MKTAFMAGDPAPYTPRQITVHEAGHFVFCCAAVRDATARKLILMHDAGTAAARAGSSILAQRALRDAVPGAAASAVCAGSAP